MKEFVKTDVCYVISHGFAARMVLHSDIIPCLKQHDIRIAIIMPGTDEPQMVSFAEKYSIRLVEAPKTATYFRHEYELLRRYFFENVRQNPALWAKHVRELQNASGKYWWRRIQAKPYLWLNQISQRCKTVPEIFQHIEEYVIANKEIADLLRQISPSVVVSTYPINPLEASTLYEAKKMGITTIGQLLSWDNITCKGRFPVIPDYFLSWGPVMSSEIKEYYGKNSDHVIECGVAHFDAHLKSPNSELLKNILENMGLDVQKPYIFFGMSSPYFAPHEIDIVEWLANAVRSDCFGSDVQLVVRPHPQNVQGNMADTSWLPRLKAIEGHRVAVDYPSLEQSSLAWSMKAHDLGHLANLLSGCAVCINSGSTISIDTLIHGKPVIISGFDAGYEFPWYLSAKRCLEYHHLHKMIALGGVRVAQCFDELAEMIKQYLKEPETDAEKRRQTVFEECGLCDGKASERVGRAIIQILRLFIEMNIPCLKESHTESL